MTAELVEWIERTIGGSVVHLERIPRWRAGWFVDVDRDGERLALYARGARGPDFPSPYDLDHEARVHRLLEDHGFPVPHVHGLCTVEGRSVLVMDRVPGMQGLAHEDDMATRQRLMLECVEHMARMHAIPVEELQGRGFSVPAGEHDVVWSGAIAHLVAHDRSIDAPADPVLVFLLGWLQRHTPAGRRPAFVTWDAAQFLHHDGRLTALIDFELAHVGDPYMDLAPLRSRDTIEPFGDLSGAFAHYSALTGHPIDFQLVRYYEVAQLTATLLLQRPVLVAPDPESDYVTHLVWYVESARIACDILAEWYGVALDGIDPVEAPAGPNAAAHGHLVDSLQRAVRAATGDDEAAAYARWRARCDYRLARHLQRVDEIGAAVTALDLAETNVFLGAAFARLADADAALIAVIEAGDPTRDVDLLGLLERRLQRRTLLLGPAGSLVARHVRPQPLPG
jgi:aminoglycoside phosphotransferase (APT) family kinase protein